MNKLLLTAVLFLGLTFSLSAQDKSKNASVHTKAEVLQSKMSGIYLFTMPQGTTEATVKQSANYYTNYFTVSFDASSHVAKITMLNNDEKSRHIICRFLISSGVDKVTMEGSEFTVDEFYNAYIK